MSFLKLNRLLQHPIKVYCSLQSSQIFNKVSPHPPQIQLISTFFTSKDKKWEKFQEEEKKYGKLIYKSPLEMNLVRSKTLSLSSSAIGVGMLPFFANALKEASMLANILVFSTCSICIFAVPLLFQYALRRHVNRMHYDYNTDTFTVYLYNFFLLEYRLQFKTEDIHVPDVPGLFTSFQLKTLKRSLFVDYDQVTDVEVIKKILGYDKPLDLNKYSNKNKNKNDDDDDD